MFGGKVISVHNMKWENKNLLQSLKDASKILKEYYFLNSRASTFRAVENLERHIKKIENRKRSIKSIQPDIAAVLHGRY